MVTFEDAVQVNASDVHIEPQEARVQIRFRIDGALMPQTEADRRTGPEAQRPARQGLYLAVAQSALQAEGFRLVQQLRQQGVCALMDYDGRSLKAQLREADKAGVRLVAILGDAEVKQRALTLKDLEQGTQRTVTFEAFLDDVEGQLKAACHSRKQ